MPDRDRTRILRGRGRVVPARSQSRQAQSHRRPQLLIDFASYFDFFLSCFPWALFCASRLMTDRVERRLQNFYCPFGRCSDACVKRRISDRWLGTSTSKQETVTKASSRRSL